MAKLDSTKRADLPDSAFAYVDSKGKRRLPINDEAHVRNALARFEQVAFEDEAARERARKKLLTAAKKYRIVPVGFITGQLQSERERGKKQGKRPLVLPSGRVTMMMTDIEDSTGLVHQLGDGYGALIDRVRGVLVDAAIAMQRDFRTRAWPSGATVRVRIGIHTGEPSVSEGNYIGMDVHAAARICAVSHGGQIVVSGATRDAVGRDTVETVRYRSLGAQRLRGIPDLVPLYQLGAKGLAAKFPPPRKS